MSFHTMADGRVTVATSWLLNQLKGDTLTSAVQSRPAGNPRALVEYRAGDRVWASCGIGTGEIALVEVLTGGVREEYAGAGEDEDEDGNGSGRIHEWVGRYTVRVIRREPAPGYSGKGERIYPSLGA